MSGRAAFCFCFDFVLGRIFINLFRAYLRLRVQARSYYLFPAIAASSSRRLIDQRTSEPDPVCPLPPAPPSPVFLLSHLIRLRHPGTPLDLIIRWWSQCLKCSSSRDSSRVINQLLITSSPQTPLALSQRRGLEGSKGLDLFKLNPSSKP